MREYSTPLTVEIPDHGNLTDDVVRNADQAPDAAVVVRPTSDGWEDVDAASFLQLVREVAAGLVAAGLEPGDRVGLLSRTRWEWTLVDYAIWFAGAVSVPLYDNASAEEVRTILAGSGARAVVVESAEHQSRLAEVRADLPALREVWCLDDDAVATLTALGEDVDPAQLEERRTGAGPDDVATIIYTSGTTGPPKGCVLTHGNLVTEVLGSLHELEELYEQEDACTLVVLPLAHVFARVVQLGAVRARVRLGHSSGVRELRTRLTELEPTFVLAVPRVFERMFNTASQRATADGRGALFDRAVEAAIARSRALDGGRVPLRVRGRHALYERLVYSRFRAAFGGRCHHAVSGGAPLGERLGHFYRGVGMPVLEGYGLTETSAAITLNRPDALKIGSVGRPLPGAAVRVADDGELLVRGGQVFAGYWDDAAATDEVLAPGGWLHTGDLGEVDDEGFVRLTGRKKEILVTAGGKNVSPTALEDRLRAHPLVGHALVVGDGQPFVGALVTLDPDTLTTWAEQHGTSDDPAELVDDPTLLAAVQQAVDAANAAVSQAEAIRRFRVLPGDWTEEGGQLTPSLKLKRAVVLRECKDDVAALYL